MDRRVRIKSFLLCAASGENLKLSFSFHAKHNKVGKFILIDEYDKGDALNYIRSILGSAFCCASGARSLRAGGAKGV